MRHTLADRLALDPVAGEPDVYLSHDETDARHVFGGLLVAQALKAARLTVDPGRHAHSLHASFLSRGHGGGRLRHEVERTRDGGSFGTRRVVVSQGNRSVMVLTADFHQEEPGLEYEAAATPGVPRPEELTMGAVQSRVFDAIDVPIDLVPRSAPHTKRTWIRARDPIADDLHLHLEGLAYLSDHGPSRAVRAPHAAVPRESIARPVSLDHSLWFHRPVDVNEWLLFELVPVATGRGRGLSFGTIRTRDDVLVATVAQEILLRPNPVD